MTALRERTQQLNAEYWAARDGMTERVAVAQMTIALAAAELGNVPERRGPAECSICGDTEPVHVHDNGERIADYFTVGRGETDFEAAARWKARALAAEADR